MHIVIVDPRRVVLRLTSEMLSSRGHTVYCFNDSQAALGFLADNEQINGLITSLEVRPICGIELCWSARLVAQPHRPLYIIAMSSLRNARTLSEALDSGADDFISKPPAMEELYARLRSAERLAAMQKELVRLSETDPLTGLLNRRAFLNHLQQIVRKGDNFAFVMFDIDHFKLINDTHGHDAGDLMLQAVAHEAMREGVVGRLGGEEFGVVYPGKRGSSACEIADHLRRRLAELRVRAPTGILSLTCSFGVSEWALSDTTGALMKRADQALYEAKAAGRNKVVAR